MARIREFYATRPAGEYARRVAALPYDVMDEAEARAMVGKEPLSFIAVDRAETAFRREAFHSAIPWSMKRLRRYSGT